MKKAIRALVRGRAGSRCEYCRLHENDLPFYPFHLEHVIARKHQGSDDKRNLCWSCNHCNLAKASNLSGRDPKTGRIVVLFNPRRQRWRRHFMCQGPRIVGRTTCGRATVEVLNMNAPRRLELRKILVAAGKFPPA